MKRYALFLLLVVVVFVILDYFFKPLYLPSPPPLIKEKQKLERLKFSFNPVQQLKAQDQINKLQKTKGFQEQKKKWEKVKRERMGRVLLAELAVAFIAASVLFWLFKLF